MGWTDWIREVERHHDALERIVALLLTAALLGGVVIAMRDEPVDKLKQKLETPRRAATPATTTSRFDASAIETKP